MEFTIPNKTIEQYNESERTVFPKYTSQLINWANQNAQGTRPPVVGQMSELFPEFMRSGREKTVDGWKQWYVEKHPEAFRRAAGKIYAQIENLREAIALIDEKMVEDWVEDLIVDKTYNGMYVQKAILAALAGKSGETYRLATPAEEAKGIDGFVGTVPYSVKPESYKTMGRLSESIEVKMIYYTKTKTGLKVEAEE
ncbi:MAG: MjaI family restriction endonuclease [Schwartzia sp.]|nr:MjaI family restriction endonuclease [Schwartzia sp. (in: firmicutes)]